MVLLILAVAVHSAFAALKTFTVQETDLVKLDAKAIDPDGDNISYTYSPPLDENGEWQTSYDDAGEYHLKITASDGINKTEEKVTLIVKPKNRKPVLDLQPITVDEGQKVVLDLPSKDLDGDELKYSLDDHFDNFGVWQTGYDDAGKYNFDVYASDGELTTKSTVAVTVNDVDRAPKLDLPGSIEVHEGEKLSLPLNTSDPDGDKITLHLDNAPEGSILDGKEFTWDVGYDFIRRKGGFVSNLLNALRLENFFLGSDSFTMQVTSCGKDLCTSKPLSLKVYNVDRAPVIENSLNTTIKENEIALLNPKVIDPDGDIVRVSFSAPFNSKGSWKTGYDDQGKHVVYVAATDGRMTTTLPVEIEVTKDNREPKLKVSSDKVVVNEGQEFSLTASAEDPDNDELSLDVEDLPEGASFKDGVFTWTPGYDVVENGSSTWTDGLVSELSYLNRKFSQDGKTIWLTFTASDGDIEVKHPVKVVVKNVNKEPELLDYMPTGTVTARVGEPVLFHVAAKDIDNDKLNYVWSFGLGAKEVSGTDTIERTFIVPGHKKVRVEVSDGRKDIAKEWSVNVLNKEYDEKTVQFSADDFKTYVIDG